MSVIPAIESLKEERERLVEHVSTLQRRIGEIDLELDGGEGGEGGGVSKGEKTLLLERHNPLTHLYVTPGRLSKRKRSLSLIWW